MPVPKPAVTAAPRVLLRDVVYAKMLEAIEDGTLEPGERLNDDDLTAWLSVSRTPVREAIARLASEGLVEMAANRYTRVASRSSERYDEAAALVAALHRHLLEAAPTLPSSARKAAAKHARQAASALNKSDLAGLRELAAAFQALAAELPGTLFASTHQTASALAQFNAAADDVEIDWAALAAEAETLAQL